MCINQIEGWQKQKEELFNGGKIEHNERSKEYASYIIEAMLTDTPYKIGGNVLNNGLITNLPQNACVEVPCMVDGTGIHPTFVVDLPVQLAAMNQTNIRAAMLDPHTAAELSVEDIVKMCDELIEAHQAKGYMLEYK